MRKHTDQEIRGFQVRAGVGGAAVAGVSAALATLDPGYGLTGLLDTAALVGGAGGSLALAAAASHSAWHFHPHRAFRRELGGSVGWLDGHDLADIAGAHAVRDHAAKMFRRPELHSEPITASGWEVGRLVSGPAHLRRRRVYCPWTRGMAIVGPPGSGKSQYVIRIALAAPGPLVLTSTKTELALAVMDIRRHTTGPVGIFNPEDIGGLTSTMAFDPVAGCEDDSVASRRASALVRGAGAGSGIKDSGFWSQKAVDILRGLMMAAAFAGLGMDAVHAWATESPDPDRDPTPVTILQRHHASPLLIGTLRENLGVAADETRAGYIANVLSAIGFMAVPRVAAACRPGAGTLDTARFIAMNATLCLIGGGQDSRIAPLMTCLTEELMHGAKAVAAASPGGVLPIPATFLLDEVANLTPVPLDGWAADSRGWGITVIPVFQSVAQMTDTWGSAAGAVIKHSLPVRVTLPGVTDTRDLDELAYLGGRRRVRVETHGESGRDSGTRAGRSRSVTRPREAVVDGDVISRMPMGHAYVTGLARHPAMVRWAPGRDLVIRRRAELGLPA